MAKVNAETAISVIMKNSVRITLVLMLTGLAALIYSKATGFDAYSGSIFYMAALVLVVTPALVSAMAAVILFKDRRISEGIIALALIASLAIGALIKFKI